MPGQEERQLRTEKKLQKRRTARQSRARAKQSLHDLAFEQAGYDEEVPSQQSVAHIHVGRNKPRKKRG